jgi:lysophospholipase L1-like esterase
LTISDYIKVVIRITNKPSWKIIVQTLQGTFNHEFSIEANAGMPRATSNGAVLSNVSLTYFNPLLWDKVWAFGDSYFGISSQVREMYWLKEWGYLNFMISGFPGASSSEMNPELERCLKIANPEFIIWCLGMNDNSTLNFWISQVNKVLSLCEKNGIKPILCTIPNVRNNVTYKNKNEMSDWVKNSGQRYVDVQKAVGANEDGEWYGNGTEYDYQSSDNVHPSEYGAKAIATQFIIDAPEIVA